jgi:DNA primase
MYNFEKLCEDYNIEFKNINRRGFVQIQCPFCGDNKFKGGLHSEKGIYVCWACGFIPINKIVKILTGENWFEIELQYKDVLDFREQYIINHSEFTPKVNSIELPRFTTSLNSKARRYLEKRGFDTYELEELYGIKSTEHMGDYPFRIIIPIHFENKIISFTSRDYTNEAELRYKSCPRELEIIPHKEILYGFDLVPKEHAICVEGPLDQWKMGPGSVATFGLSFTQAQINLLATFFKVTLLYDSGETAKRRCERLGEQLSGLGCEVEAIYLKDYKDPGEIPLGEARSLTKQILGE